MWIFQWFITFFVYSFPLEYIRELITFILLHKDFASIKLALAIMDILAASLLKIEDRDQFEDNFIMLVEQLKDYKYCQKHLPLKEILEKAEEIDDSPFRKANP